MADTRTYSSLTAVMCSLGPARPAPREPVRWCKVTLASLTAVEELLDWLENSGYEERRMAVVKDAFVVRWR